MRNDDPAETIETLNHYADRLSEIGTELGQAVEGINAYNEETGEFDGGEEFDNQDAAHDRLWSKVSPKTSKPWPPSVLPCTIWPPS